ncbi:uncharacterized protein LOC127211549 [Acomys russatus]|uniref:uncharacterized protein LOC127211549 n=1 Tax=Acomys russatus TaxID=60746 RepID=UPI0021E2F55E|nr:uncharacterized protein LOC127211549 [Acomys russatus]
MSGRQVSRSNTYSHSSHPNNTSFPPSLPPRTPGLTQHPNMTNGKGTLSRCSSTSSGNSEQSYNSSSPKLPVGRVCMGRPYNSRCVETSHLVKGSKVAKKPTCHRSSPHCLLCTDRPSRPSSPTFLDQLIKGISYLDRSTNVFSNSSFPKALSLPQLAATYLERAANSLYLDQTEHAPSRSYSTPSTNTAPPSHSPANSSLIPSTRDTNALQFLGGPTSLNCQPRPHSQGFFADMPQKPGVKLPEIPLFGNGFFSLGRLPKFWEAIRSGMHAPEPTSKPSGWW